MYRKWMRKNLKYNTMECRDIKKQNGSITLEASVFLSLFIMFYVALMSLVQIAKAQVVLQYSINEVAKEVSACSYILTKTGIVEKRLSTSERANEFKAQTGEVVNAVLDVKNALANGGDVIGSAQNAVNQVQSYFSDSDALMDSILSLVKQKGADIISTQIIQSIVENEVEKQIDIMSYKGADKYLKDLGIVDGLNGLKFEGTKWCNSDSGGMPELEIVLTYTIDFNLGMIELEPREYKLCAKTALW